MSRSAPTSPPRAATSIDDRAPRRERSGPSSETDHGSVAAITTESTGVHRALASEDTEITTEWHQDGWLVVSKWYRASLGGVLARSAGAGDRRFRVREESDSWSFTNDRERVTVTASDAGRTFTEHWEVRDDDGAWQPLCEVVGTRVDDPEISA